MPGIDEQSESSVVARSDRSQTEASSIDLEWEHEAGNKQCTLLRIKKKPVGFEFRRNMYIYYVFGNHIYSFPSKTIYCVDIILLYSYYYLKYFSFTEHVRLLKTSFQAPLSFSSGLGTTKQMALIYVAKLTSACLMQARGCCKTLMM